MRKQKESGNWKPTRWKKERITTYLQHLRKCVFRTLRETDGVHNGNLLAAAFSAVLDSEESATAIRSMGYAMIGEQERKLEGAIVNREPDAGPLTGRLVMFSRSKYRLCLYY